MQNNKGKILNEIENKVEYKSTYPAMKGKGEFKALHELHVFLMPINPDQKLVDLAIEATNKYNEKYATELGDYKMKMCYLTLLFRNVGQVKVLQSARYLRSDDQDEVVKEIYKDSEFYQ